MKELDYSILDNIRIEDCNLIVKTGVVQRFCWNNEIRTLGELLKKYDNNEFVFRNKKGKEEISGFIDLVKYYYFDINLPLESILFDEIRFYKDTWKGKYWPGNCEANTISSVSNFPLRRLGFTSNESCLLENYIIDKMQSNLIIKTILEYISDPKKRIIHLKKEQEVFERKLQILANYYYNKCVPGDKLNIYKLIELEEHLKRYEILCKKRNSLNLEIEELSNVIKNMDKYFGNNGEVKKLIKSYIGDNKHD